MRSNSSSMPKKPTPAIVFSFIHSKALGLRIFEGTGADVPDLGEEHGHRDLLVYGKDTKVVLVSCRQALKRPPADSVR